MSAPGVVDVAVIGRGTAAVAAALSLAQINRSFVAIGPDAAAGDRVGDSLSPAARAYLADLRLVPQAWEENQTALVLDLLEGQRPERTDGVERRGNSP